MLNEREFSGHKRMIQESRKAESGSESFVLMNCRNFGRF